MSKTATIDISHIRLTSMAQPTDEDVALWDSLTSEEKQAVFDREIEEARASGIAPKQTMAEMTAEFRTEMANEL